MRTSPRLLRQNTRGSSRAQLAVLFRKNRSNLSLSLEVPRDKRGHRKWSVLLAEAPKTRDLAGTGKDTGIRLALNHKGRAGGTKRKATSRPRLRGRGSSTSCPSKDFQSKSIFSKEQVKTKEGMMVPSIFPSWYKPASQRAPLPPTRVNSSDNLSG